MDVDHNLIDGCGLCGLFLNPSGNIHSKIHYIDNKKVSQSDFIILDCESYNAPMVVVRDHVPTISKDIWGRVLYQCKKNFNKPNLRLRFERNEYEDHWHAFLLLQGE